MADKNLLSGRFLGKILLIAALALVVFAGCTPSFKIKNPYETVDWKNDAQYKANLHTHTMVSDGWMNPHTVVEKYRAAGYRILAITDHNSVTYPWTEFSKFGVSSKTQRRIDNGELKPQEEEMMTPEDLNFENVKPDDVKMIDIQGDELSSHHHTSSLFNDHNGTTTEDKSLEAVTSKNGIAFLNHPGRYHDTDPKHYSLDWYLDLFRRYPHLLGMEVYNCGKRFPHDDMLWDSILTVMAPVRPVWGFSNDDMHSMRDLGHNWNVFPLPELNEQAVRHAIENGIFYFVFAPGAQDGILPPVIKSINVNQQRGKIQIDVSGCDSIVWFSEGKRVVWGSHISLANLQGDINYVRAELYGEGFSVVCTQPFYIERTE